MAKNKSRIGNTGELIAAAKLTELGYFVGIVGKNSPGIDILISNGKAAKMIQVKNTENMKPDWVCQKPKDTNSNIVYIFVGKNKDASYFFHIASSKDVFETIEKKEAIDCEIYKKKNHKEPPKTDRVVPHFVDEEGKFKDKWEKIGLPLVNTDQ